MVTKSIYKNTGAKAESSQNFNIMQYDEYKQYRKPLTDSYRFMKHLTSSSNVYSVDLNVLPVLLDPDDVVIIRQFSISDKIFDLGLGDIGKLSTNFW